MWVKARDFQGNFIWLNVALARTIERTVDDPARGAEAMTIISFDEAHQQTVHETPEELLAAILTPPGTAIPS